MCATEKAEPEINTAQEETGCCCHCKTTARSQDERKKLMNRLSRIEGQIRGIKGMLEKDAYCNDILIQSAAIFIPALFGISGREKTKWWMS